MNRYISDLHFGHQNIIKFDHRPFNSTQEMECALIANWNSVVKSDDTTYILGDFCWSASETEWIRLLDLLNGNKVLIRGNHDLKNMSSNLKKKFLDIKDYKEITDNQKHVIVCHYPILLYKNSYNPNCYMLCGHVHTTIENDYLVKWRWELRQNKSRFNDSVLNCGNIYNIGCMLLDYTPRTLEEIINS